VLALGVLVLGTAQAQAAGGTLWVNDDASSYAPPGSSCDRAGFPTIQSAVTAATAGSTINVCPGTYAEQVNVATPAKSGITLRSVVPFGATILAPPTMEAVFGDLVTIDAGARDVTLRGFVVSGPLPDQEFCAAQLRAGVRVKGGSSANILGNRITKIRSANPALRGCQNGFAIAVGRTFDVPVPGQVGQATIVGNVIDTYQKGGIYADNVGTQVTITANAILGDGPQSVVAQNGIQVSRGAKALIQSNTIQGNSFFTTTLPCVVDATCVTAAGIIVFETDNNVAIDRNDLRRNQTGIDIETANGNSVTGNQILGETAPEIVATGFGDGIFLAADTAANRIVGNVSRNNVQFDCEDDSTGPNRPALVANLWQKDEGLTQNKPGLCRASHNDD
ncbi:MAG: hypothetical protein QOH95_1377, partial [Gaiellaceae bacterium]|nr:hypothetical protein [Gaiellaceae bacterium]